MAIEGRHFASGVAAFVMMFALAVAPLLLLT